MTPSKILVLLSFGFLGGVFVGSFLSFSWLAAFAVLLAAVILLIIGSNGSRPRVLVGGLLIVALLFGFSRATLSSKSSQVEEIQFFKSARINLVERSRGVIGPPEQALFSAMVLGYRDDLSAEIKTVFNRTGTRHILAISGMHLAIVAVLLFEFLIFLGLWRKQAFWPALAGIILFVLLVGLPPSAVRAGVMAGLYLTARQVGRLSESWRLLLVAAVLMVLLRPDLLVFNVGFQLSFLAVLGIIAFTPFFERWLRFLPGEPLRRLLSVSLAAQLTTWPLVASTFKTVSMVGPLANLIVVPLLPLVMLFGLLFVALGWWSVVLAKIVLWPAWVLLHFISEFLSLLSRFRYASLEIAWFGLILAIIYYGFLIFIYWRFGRNANNVWL